MPVPTGGTLRIEEPPEPRDSKVHCLYYMVETPVSSTVRMTEEKAAEMLRDLTRRFERGELPLTWNTVFKPLPGHFYIHLRNNVMHHPAQDGYFWTTPQDVKLAYTISDREEVVVYKVRGGLDIDDPTLVLAKTRYQSGKGMHRWRENFMIIKEEEPMPQPKKPGNPYQLFMKARWKEVKDQNPNVAFENIGKVMSALWTDLAPEEKQMWSAKYDRAVARYQKEKAEHQRYLDSLQKAKEAAALAAGLPPYQQQVVEEMRARGMPIPPQLMRKPQPTLEVYDEAEDDFSRKYVSAARYKRNHDMMADLLDGLPPPKAGKVENDTEGLQTSTEELRAKLEQMRAQMKEMEGKVEERWKVRDESMRGWEEAMGTARACQSLQEQQTLLAQCGPLRNIEPRRVPDITVESFGWNPDVAPTYASL